MTIFIRIKKNEKTFSDRGSGFVIKRKCSIKRNDEYSCRHQDKSGEALYLNVFKDRFNFASTNYTIEKEMNDKFFAKAKSTGQTATFYKELKN